MDFKLFFIGFISCMFSQLIFCCGFYMFEDALKSRFERKRGDK